MWQKDKFIIQVIALLLVVFQGFTKALYYRVTGENDEILSACTEKMDDSRTVVDVHGLANMSELTYYMTESLVVSIAGNVTLVWDIQKSDRIDTNINVYHFERSGWRKTILSMKINDTCKVLYDKNQYWYTAWTQYIINADDVKDKCLNVPGTKLMHRPFELDESVYIPGPSLEGLNKAVITFKAFDAQNNQRGPTVCIEYHCMFEAV